MKEREDITNDGDLNANNKDRVNSASSEVVILRDGKVKALKVATMLKVKLYCCYNKN